MPTFLLYLFAYLSTNFLSQTAKNCAINVIKAHTCLYANPIALLKKRKITARTTLPTIADNASGTFPASLLRVSTSLFNDFLKASLSFVRKTEPPTPPLKILVIASTIAEIDI